MFPHIAPGDMSSWRDVDALRAACGSGDVAAMRALLYPADLRHALLDGTTSLMLAENGNLEAMRLLLDYPTADSAAIIR
jgi:hypothetical protein